MISIISELADRTFTISMGWMTLVASMPEAPPLTKGLTVGHTPPAGFLSSPISADLVFSPAEMLERETHTRTQGRVESKRGQGTRVGKKERLAINMNGS